VARETNPVNPNDIIVQATVAVMVLGVLVVACIAGWRRFRVYRARKQLIKSFENVSAAVLRDVLIPDGSGGQLHIDFLLLTGKGLLVVDYRDVEGVVFGGEHMREWAVMNGSARTTFLNPLEALNDRIAAVRPLAGDSPDGIRAVLKERLEKLACDFDVKDNYFAQQAFGRRYGRSAGASLPPYLQPENHADVVARIDRVEMLHATFIDQLSGLPDARQSR